jgi:excisionase family DNA binding protein
MPDDGPCSELCSRCASSVVVATETTSVEQAGEDQPLSADILTAMEVASLFGLDRKTIYAAVKRSEIPHKRVGRKLLFSQRVLLEWWTSQGRVVSERR